MKKPLLIVLALFLSCKESETSKHPTPTGGEITALGDNRYRLDLPCGQKFIGTTYDIHSGPGYLTRNMRPEEFPETYTFVPSMNGTWIGVYNITESRCQPSPTNNCTNSN